MLLDAGIDVNAQNVDGDTALMVLTKGQNEEMFSFFEHYSEEDRKVIIEITEKSYIDVAEMLVEKSDLNLQNKNGDSILEILDKYGTIPDVDFEKTLENIERYKFLEIIQKRYEKVFEMILLTERVHIVGKFTNEKMAKMAKYYEVFEKNKDLFEDYILELDKGFLHMNDGCFDLGFKDNLTKEDWRPYD